MTSISGSFARWPRPFLKCVTLHLFHFYAYRTMSSISMFRLLHTTYSMSQFTFAPNFICCFDSDIWNHAYKNVWKRLGVFVYHHTFWDDEHQCHVSKTSTAPKFDKPTKIPDPMYEIGDDLIHSIRHHDHYSGISKYKFDCQFIVLVFDHFVSSKASEY